MPLLTTFGAALINGFMVLVSDSRGLFPFTQATFKSPIQATMWSISSTVTGSCLGPTQAQLSTTYQSFIDASGTNQTRVNSGDSVYPNSGYVTIRKL